MRKESINNTVRLFELELKKDGFIEDAFGKKYQVAALNLDGVLVVESDGFPEGHGEGCWYGDQI